MLNDSYRADKKAEAAAQSERAGRSFGNLIKQNFTFNLPQAQQFCDKLRPKPPLLISSYKKGFMSLWKVD